ncbi:MAG TPA: prenyltransferase [Pseudogracilibacillus sp.]|nr:prenyltransferase [Pseudogracilibacillus sp.]
MHPTPTSFSLKGIGMLLRFVAVLFSSVVAVFSTALPLFFHYTLSGLTILSVTFILLIGALLIHGLLTHTFNDLVDYQSGTDQDSPGILSGGSKVLKTGKMSVSMLIQLAISLSLLLLLITVVFLVLGYPKLAILTLVGIWGAASYSLKPFQFAYYPFLGEWFSLFPTMLLLGIAAPWILLDQVPIWAWQNALINAIWCMAWVMVHHIPDREADRIAQPTKRTSVVWVEDTFGKQAVTFPALFYFLLVGILLVWLAFTRPVGALGAGLILMYSIYLVMKMNIDDVESVTNVEKQLLVFAFSTAILLGIFVYN